jgi:hypothetical protein
MHRRDSETVFGRLAILAVAGGLAAGLSACANLPHGAEGGFPKFTDIPLKAGPTTPASEAQANADILRGMASALAAQGQTIAAAPTDTDALTAARAVATQVQAPTDADAAATEAFLRSARARATPPPVRK